MHKHLVLFFLLITSLSCCFDGVLPNRYTLSGSNDALTEKEVFQVVDKDQANSEKENLTYADHDLISFFCVFGEDLDNKEKERKNLKFSSTNFNFYSYHSRLGNTFFQPVSRPVLKVSLYLFNCIFLI